MSNKSAGRAFADELERCWLAAVDRVEKYTPVRDFGELPPEALASSCFWCSSLFPSCADPHEPALSARVSVHVATAETLDLIKYDYLVNGISATLIEGRNFALLRVARESVDILALPPGERSAEIRRIAAAIFSGEGRPPVGTFALPKTIKEGSRFSTAPSANPLFLATWSDRIDGGIHRGGLYFLCYKRVPQLVGFLNAHAWFDEAFRAQHHG